VNLEMWNNLINVVNPVYKTDVKDFVKNADTIVTHGIQKEVLIEIDNCNVLKTVFDLVDSSNNYIKNN